MLIFCPHSSHPLFSRLEVLVSSFGLQKLITESTHNHHNGSATTIHLMFVSTLKLGNHCVVIPFLHNSDHNDGFLGCYWKLSTRHNPVNRSAGRTVWNYKMSYWERTKELISDFNWNTLLSNDVNVALSNWSQSFFLQWMFVPQSRHYLRE